VQHIIFLNILFIYLLIKLIYLFLFIILINFKDSPAVRCPYKVNITVPNDFAVFASGNKTTISPHPERPGYTIHSY
jgi:hypothetical protein